MDAKFLEGRKGSGISSSPDGAGANGRAKVLNPVDAYLEARNTVNVREAAVVEAVRGFVEKSMRAVFGELCVVHHCDAGEALSLDERGHGDQRLSYYAGLIEFPRRVP